MFRSGLASLSTLSLAAFAPLAATAQSVSPSRQTQAEMRSVWINPYGDVKVETGDCGGKLCGWVVWATPEAEQEVRDAGSQRLVGTELLQDYRQTAYNQWEGRVFVPDMGRTFASTIKRVEPNALKVSGCIMGGFFYKSQIWRKA